MIHLKKNQSGVTLIEVVVVIALLGILAGFAYPNFKSWIPNYKLKAAARDLVSNFQRAKMEAVKRNKWVVVSFTPGTYSSSGMVGSYQIFVDDGTGGGTARNFTRDGSELIITQIIMPKYVTLYAASFSGGTTAAGFDGKGLPASSRIGNVKLRNNNSRYYKVTLSIAGNINVQKSNDGTNWQ